MDPTSKQSVIDRINQANNILITVKNNPTIDQLAACIGASLFFNKLGKHTTAVFSGAVPSTIEFLKPKDIIETSTDSLRDFIISLDTEKADKIKWKVDKNAGIVKIFITPYRTSISHEDLEFTHGDLNVDVLIGLGVESQADIDAAITAHGRILHDATVITMNTDGQGNLGTLHLEDKSSSSLCELFVELADSMKPGSFDQQMATAFLTGIVAETNRFSNEKTSPKTMSLASELMKAGANQQLISTKLQPSEVAGGEAMLPQIQTGEPKTAGNLNEISISHEEPVSDQSRMTSEPRFNTPFTASVKGKTLEPSLDILGNTSKGDTLEHGMSNLPADKTLSEIEFDVKAPHQIVEDMEQVVGSEHTTLQPLTPSKISIPASEAAVAVAEPGGPIAGPIEVKPLDQQPSDGRESVDEALRAVQEAAKSSPPPQITPPPPPNELGGLPFDANAPMTGPVAPVLAPSPPPSSFAQPFAPVTPEPFAPMTPTEPLPPAPQAPVAPPTYMNTPPPPGPPPMMPPTV